jgi:tetratricopeptide (TPR) repeat protein
MTTLRLQGVRCVSLDVGVSAVAGVAGVVRGWLVGVLGVGMVVGVGDGVRAGGVVVREERVVLPTYVAGEPERSPMFFFGRASQGAEGRVYPYPLYDTLTRRREERAYRMVWLENEHVRLGILPEIGGRLFEGVDKSNGYDFIYRQHVIKPALIGLIGAWISGGVEWNIPHHHRASTFIPVQDWIESGADGSRTVWVGELEVRHRMRWAVGYTLYPGRSVVEAKLRIVNRTPAVETMLCFANVAVHANENYQVIFPPRTQWVTHHHKREFTTWPVATTRYGGYDFSAGVDVSWYANHEAANSMFAWNDEDAFMAGYDHGRGAGLLSVADPHIVPGKKLWTWGTGPRGRMWDKILTDADGPYIELMVGAYSDNQPDYSWLEPFEAKSFSIYWYPFRDIGGVKNATVDAAVNVEVTNRVARLGFCATAVHPVATVGLSGSGGVLFEQEVAMTPARGFTVEVELPAGVEAHELRASLRVGGREMVSYTPMRFEPEPMPEPVRAPGSPSDVPTVEELYLAGLRIEQFHHPTLEPEPYWEEALRRDPGDARVNTAMGIRRFKQARWGEAEDHLRRAVGRLTANHTAPKEGEALYYLGMVLKAQGRLGEAYRVLYRSTWSSAWSSAGYYGLAEMDSLRGDWEGALAHVNRALAANALHVRAWSLKGAMLRRLGRLGEVTGVLEAAGRVDPLDVRLRAERWLATRSGEDRRLMVAEMLAHPATALETAAEYLNAGLWADGEGVLREWVKAAGERGVTPLGYYYLGFFADRQGRKEEAVEWYRAGSGAGLDTVFPFQQELVTVLGRAVELVPEDARAAYHLGNLWFDWMPAEAVRWWERSAGLDGSLAMVHRNLGIAYSHQKTGNALDRAVASLERAVGLPDPDPLHLHELDELYEAVGMDPAKRLEVFERYADTVARRDDAQSRRVALLVWAGRYDEAIGLMTGREFAVWEGASLSVAEHWIDAHILRGHGHRWAGRLGDALADYQRAGRVPENLPSERRGSGGREAEALYWLGVVQAGLGEVDEARASWGRAVEVRGARDEQRYFQGRAWGALGEGGRAVGVFGELVGSGERRSEGGGAIDYFASFGEQQSQRARWALSHYLVGLGRMGLGERAGAVAEFERVLEIRPDHVWARAMLEELRRGG